MLSNKINDFSKGIVMKKKEIAVILSVMLILIIVSSTALAETKYSEWYPARTFPNIYHQLVNRYGDEGWDGVRWANQNQFRVKITVRFYYQKTGDNVGTREVFLEGGNTYSAIVDLGPGVWFEYKVEKE